MPKVSSGRIFFKLQPVAPFRLDLTVWALRRRTHNLVDRWDGRTYRRVLTLGETIVEVEVSQSGPPEGPEVLVTGQGAPPGSEAEKAVIACLTRMLGLEVDLSGFYGFCQTEPRLRQLSQRFRGVKPPRFPTLFEALVNAITCQQLSLTLGIHLLNRLAAVEGVSFPGPSGETDFNKRFREIFGSHFPAPQPEARDGPGAKAKKKLPLLPLTISLPRPVSFPRPQDLAGLTPENFRALGYSRSKGRFIIGLTQRLVDQTLNLEEVGGLDDAAAIKRLEEIPGVGRWSAEYALLRGLGRWHLFPGDDVGARQKLARWLGYSGSLDYDGVRRLLGGWQPYGGLIYFHLLLDGLAAEGYLGEVGGGG